LDWTRKKSTHVFVEVPLHPQGNSLIAPQVDNWPWKHESVSFISNKLCNYVADIALTNLFKNYLRLI